MDSASVAGFFADALDRGRLVYVTHGPSPDTLVIERAPDASVSLMSADPTDSEAGSAAAEAYCAVGRRRA